MEFNEKQKFILHTAEKLFACKGFDGTSIRDIAEAAHVNIAMISYYFGSKDKLMQALFYERTAEVTLRLESLLNDSSLDTWQKMSVIVDEYVERVWQRQTFFKIMMNEQLLQKNEVINEMITVMKKQNMDLMDQIIREGQRKKLFKRHFDSILVSNTIMGTAWQTFLNKESYRKYHHLEEEDDIKFLADLKDKTRKHIKTVIKEILRYEA
ncbi:MAG: TetR/AcrR family transcriptional regulator [Candidatus Dadabacteria bacterium]